MITEADVYAALQEIFAELFMRDDIRLSPNTTATDIVGWDSFKQVEILMATQERFGTRFTSAEVDGFRTLGDLVAAILRRGS